MGRDLVASERSWVSSLSLTRVRHIQMADLGHVPSCNPSRNQRIPKALIVRVARRNHR
jgi:hypothetical protein